MAKKDKTDPNPEPVFESLDALLDGKVSARVPVQICLDPGLARRLHEARTALRVQEAMVLATGAGMKVKQAERADRVEELREQIAALEAEADGKLRTILFASIGSNAFDQLLAEHRPTSAQKKRAKLDADDRGEPFRPPEYNEDTFPAAIISAAAVSPPILPDEADALFQDDRLNKAELAIMLQAAVDAQNVFLSV